MALDGVDLEFLDIALCYLGNVNLLKQRALHRTILQVYIRQVAPLTNTICQPTAMTTGFC